MSDKATSCPKCGCPSTEWTKKEETIKKTVEVTPINVIAKPTITMETQKVNVVTPTANVSILEDITRKFPREQRTLMVRELKKLTGIETSQAINAIDTYLDKGEDILGITKEQLQYQQNLTNPMANMVFCRWCGNKVPDSAMFCQQCGKPIASKPENEENSTAPQQTEIKEKVNRCEICGTKIQNGQTKCLNCKNKLSSGNKKTSLIMICVSILAMLIIGVIFSAKILNIILVCLFVVNLFLVLPILIVRCVIDKFQKNEHKLNHNRMLNCVLFTLIIFIGMLVTLLPSTETIPETSNVQISRTDNTEKENQLSNGGLFKDELNAYNSGDYKHITVSDLNKYHTNMSGVKIACVIKVSEVDGNIIRSTLDDGFMMSTFNMTKEYKDIKRDDVLAVMGEVGNYNDYAFMGKSITFNNCMIFAKGSEAEKYRQSTSDNSLQQYFQVTSEVAESGVDLSKEEFINLCKKLGYNEILRNPDAYNGSYCIISGNVNQVIDGIFDSCTLYIVDSNGNKWECYYYYGNGERRVLENDNITVYGICKGTANSTTLLGKQVTMPSVDVEYIE